MHATTLRRGCASALFCISGAALCANQSDPVNGGPAVAGADGAVVGQALPSAPSAPAVLPLPAPQSKPVSALATAPAPAPARALDQSRGGADTVTNNATLSGVVGNNSATQVTTGANIIQSNSFANASGIPVVIQNSGANVLIQNATIINLQLK